MSAFGSAFYSLLEVNTLRALVGNLRIFVRIRIRILPVVQSADPHFTRSRHRVTPSTPATPATPASYIKGIAAGKTTESDRHPNPTTNHNLIPYLVAVRYGSLARA